MSRHVCTGLALVLLVVGLWSFGQSQEPAKTEPKKEAVEPKKEAAPPPAPSTSAEELFRYELSDERGALRARGEFHSATNDSLLMTVGSTELTMARSRDSADLVVRKKMQLNLHAQDGSVTKTIEARPDGTSVINRFGKNLSRLYEVIDNSDGSATIHVYSKDKQRYTIEVKADGSLNLVSAAE